MPHTVVSVAAFVEVCIAEEEEEEVGAAVAAASAAAVASLSDGDMASIAAFFAAIAANGPAVCISAFDTLAPPPCSCHPVTATGTGMVVHSATSTATMTRVNQCAIGFPGDVATSTKFKNLDGCGFIAVCTVQVFFPVSTSSTLDMSIIMVLT